jgi:hypothetical protein
VARFSERLRLRCICLRGRGRSNLLKRFLPLCVNNRGRLGRSGLPGSGNGRLGDDWHLRFLYGQIGSTRCRGFPDAKRRRGCGLLDTRRRCGCRLLNAGCDGGACDLTSDRHGGALRFGGLALFQEACHRFNGGDVLLFVDNLLRLLADR